MLRSHRETATGGEEQRLPRANARFGIDVILHVPHLSQPGACVVDQLCRSLTSFHARRQTW